MLRNEQITSLGDQLLKASTEEEAIQTASQLKAALHEHLETIRGDLFVSIAQEITGDTPRTPAVPES
jgi:hypothetical protein